MDPKVQAAIDAIKAGPFAPVWARRDLRGVRAVVQGDAVRVAFTYAGGKRAAFTFRDGIVRRVQERER